MANYNSGTQMFYTRIDGQSYCFSPVPLLAESKEYIRVPNDGSSLAIITNLTFNGILLPEIPALSGVDPNATCIELLDRKSDQLAYALEQDRGSLIVVDSSGYTVLNVRPRVVSLNFDESQIVNHRKYSIVFEYESFEGSEKVREYEQTWSFQQQEDDTVAVSHGVSALGVYDPIGPSTALANAKSFVLARANSLDKTQSAFLQTPYLSALISVNSLTGYNHSRSENSDIVQGRFEIAETWIMSSGSYRDDRTIEQTWDLGSNNELVQTLNINGTVQGFGDITFDRYNEAVSAFDNVIASEIGFYGAGISSRSLSKNRFAGTVNYNLVKAPTDGSTHIESRNISRTLERNEDGSVTQTVTTSAALRAGSPSGIEVLIDFVWANNEPINSAEPPFSASLSGNVETTSVQRDEVTKSITLTRSYRDQSTLNYREEYEVSRQVNTDTSLISISINGTVHGLSREPGTKTEARFVAASGAYFSTIAPLSRARCYSIIPSGYCIGNNSVSSTLGVNRLAGIISYSDTYDSRFLTSNPAILDEQIEINFVGQADVVAEIGIPGKADGPILQDQETVTGLQKTLRVQYTMIPSGTGGACGGSGGSVANNNLLLSSALTESNILVNNTPSQNGRGEKPESSAVFKVQDEYSWNRQSLVFQRNVAWKYLP